MKRIAESLALAVAVVVTATGPALAQVAVSGTATPIYSNVAGLVNQPVTTSLPSGGGAVSDDLDSWSVPGVVSAGVLTAGSSGGASATQATAHSIASVANLSILNGLIRADQVLALANAVSGPSVAASDGEGSTFSNLVVAGVPMDASPAPNTRHPLPGVGYVVLNERTASGTGVTVNMIHVVLQDFLGRQTGEIIVGSATSAVGS